ncbi:hypothetical protein Pan44_33300 [Caulifigura coniformis]|uniref:Uncharacterized protein n=1 Tax=Caulifigura coniformis TaxID=2527983 RepID=A0A517SGR9_9PLAN|nr:hypothetical protein [Caulifigura coniformis]QDT55287.1 hypothetical protein Pan44_33300 [Caulifigura coniformis]
MSRERLRSNVQVRSAGVDPSVALLVCGLVVSALVLLTMLGVKAESRRRQDILGDRPNAASSDFGH